MTQYYIDIHDIATVTIRAYKVYWDGMPKEVPEVFRKSKLVCFDEIKLEKGLSGHYEMNISKHSMTDVENMNRKLYGMDNITEERWEFLLNRCEILRKVFDNEINNMKV